jgi:hypothetical protein
LIRLLVCGGRDYVNERKVFEILHQYKGQVSILIHGFARGADSIAQQWAVINRVPELGFKAQWERFGAAAGPKRNMQMLIEGKPTLVIAFPGGRGTEHMKRITKDAGIPLIEVEDV